MKKQHFSPSFSSYPRFIFLLSCLLFCIPYCSFAQQADAESKTDTTLTVDSTWSTVAAEDESYGLFVFHFGNGMIATLDETAAKDIGAKVGVLNPVRGINKTGNYYAAIMREDMMKALANGGSMTPILIKGYLATNGKIYHNIGHYLSKPQAPLVDPEKYGRYAAEDGGQPKVFGL